MNKIKVVDQILKANDAVAVHNRAHLDQAGCTAINIMSAPGSGKTSLLQWTLKALEGKYRCAVLVGDLQTTRDAERLDGLGAEVLQINTGSGCHLSATMIAAGLRQLTLQEMDFVFIENVGNMVCPAAHDLGEHLRVVLLSVPEGDDKVAKYPTLFQPADAILLSKIDLMEVLEFNCEQVRDDLSKINTKAPLIEISSRTGAGMEAWLNWLAQRRSI